MIINGANGDRTLSIEMHTSIPLTTKFDTITLTARDFDYLVRLDPVGLHEWAQRVQARFPQPAEKPVAVRDELADLLS